MQKKKNIFIISILVLIVIGYAAAGQLQGLFVDTVGTSGKTFAELADEVMEACAEENNAPHCYDTEIPRLMDKGLTMEEAFQVTVKVQERDPSYFYCHVLGHNLSAKEAAKDLSKWTEVIARAPTGVCSNGAIHGAFQERFRDKVFVGEELQELIPQLDTICENSEAKTFTGLEQASCYHALGHLSMYITDAHISEATGVCDQVAKKGERDYTQTCYEGAYMQIFQPLEPEDFALVEDIEPETQAEAEAFCRTFSGERRAACHRESWPLYREELSDPNLLQRFCNLVPDGQSMHRCYNAMFYVLTAQFNFDASRIVPICEGLPQERQGQCFANSASRFIETDYRLASRAVDLCEIAEEHGVGQRCYDELLFYSTFNFIPDSEPFKTFCRTLPEPWSTQCLNKEGYNIQPNANDIQ
ncbi:MAG: hypothetical protein ACJKTH_03845 [Patescibacteria group bacterium UBA2163]